MSIQLEVSESITWTTFGLVLETRCPAPDRFWVIVRHVGSEPVLWDGEFFARGRSLDDLPADEFMLEVLARIVRDQSDRLGRFVYQQDDLRLALRDFTAALPDTFRG